MENNTAIETAPNQPSWILRRWRPAMAWLYFAVCFFDFAVFPVLWPLTHALLGTEITPWSPLTLQGAGLFHIAMGAIIGVFVYGRTQEKIGYGITTVQDQPDWVITSWRPAMAWLYFTICIFDFILAPIFVGIVYAASELPVMQWDPLTLQGAGLFHLAMGAIIGVYAYSRTQEKLSELSSRTDTDEEEIVDVPDEVLTEDADVSEYSDATNEPRKYFLTYAVVSSILLVIILLGVLWISIKL